MSPETPEPSPQQGDDQIMNMIREGLDMRDRASAAAMDLDPKPEPEPAPEPTKEPAPEPKEEPTETPVAEPEPVAVLDPVEELRQENLRLKERLGRQGNQVGSLREQLAALGETLDSMRGTPSTAADSDPREAAIKAFRDKYGHEFADDVLGVLTVTSADLRSKSLLADLRAEHSDFQKFEPQMAEILRADPDLRAAVKTRPSLLHFVYQAAKGASVESVAREAEARARALADKQAAEKKAAFVEKPGGVQNKGPAQMSVHKIGQEKLDDILAAEPDGRRRRQEKK